jgi:hypothetical protein
MQALKALLATQLSLYTLVAKWVANMTPLLTATTQKISLVISKTKPVLA